MIDLNEIKKCTNDRFFQRGRDLYNIGKVLSIDIEKDEESGFDKRKRGCKRKW